MGKKIVLLTSGQPSLNPRLVKEADSLSEAGFEVLVIYQYWNTWGTQLDSGLLPTKRWKSVLVGGQPCRDKFKYWLSSAVYKIAFTLGKNFGVKAGLAELAIARSSYLLYFEAKKHVADLYIGHNLGALPATAWVGKFHHKKTFFDLEDFHRNEVSDDPGSFDVRLKKYLEEKYIPRVDYLTSASPLIAESYSLLFPEKKFHTILNVFPRIDSSKLEGHKEYSPLKIFWFSQTIGLKRGLEYLFDAIGRLNEFDIELHLLGQMQDGVQEFFGSLLNERNIVDKVFFYQPIPSDTITEFASKFDIGFAAELGAPLNRDICLTNKIFTYIQAGLALLASDTKAQKLLLLQYNGIGFSYKRDSVDDLTDKIKYYYIHRKILAKKRLCSLEFGKNELNWEIESRKFLTLIKTAL